MAKLEKLLERIRSNPKHVSFDDVQRLLEAYGFRLRRGKGSHRIFTGRVAGRKVNLVIPYRHPHIRKAYVKDVLELIAEIERTGENGDTTKEES